MKNNKLKNLFDQVREARTFNSKLGAAEQAAQYLSKVLQKRTLELVGQIPFVPQEVYKILPASAKRKLAMVRDITRTQRKANSSGKHRWNWKALVAQWLLQELERRAALNGQPPRAKMALGKIAVIKRR